MTVWKLRWTGQSRVSAVWISIAFSTVACLQRASVAIASGTVEWTQYYGPNRNNLAPETITRPASGPKKLWESAVGWGYSSFAVAKGSVYTMGSSNKLNSATTYCLDAATGKVLWEHTISLKVREMAGCTPSISGDRVISAGPGGELMCLNATNGSVIWEEPMGLKPFLYLRQPPVHQHAMAVAESRGAYKTKGCSGVRKQINGAPPRDVRV